jgi:hypothetical protein
MALWPILLHCEGAVVKVQNTMLMLQRASKSTCCSQSIIEEGTTVQAEWLSISGSWFRASAITTMNKKPTRCTIVLKSLIRIQ